MIEGKLAPNMPQWMVDHAKRYIESGGTDGQMYTIQRPGSPPLTVASLLLATKGRKSGETYIFPLFYGETGSSYFVIASKGGAPEHPSWYRNLEADPEVGVQVGTRTVKARARTAKGPEREKLWEQAVKFFPPYADYKVKAGDREIPVVVLDPIG
ncbi:MAG: nitroreductase family deazaflavin-dependent oxidoreductase [Rhodospirillales bacterium]|nr:nitroreductase family deazaflavin-dependent oxidoreductase [Rhodospirillales bacterium]MBN8927546.1 nitroreductase family deazaflavin-dependent oxidoreductase [Rhodospirillales bacterium]